VDEQERLGNNSIDRTNGEKPVFKKPSFWLGLLNLALACGALVVAGLAYCQGGKALEWQKERDRIKVELRAELDGSHFAIEEVIQRPHILYDSGYSGVSIFSLLKVNNLGGTRVSIDDIYGRVKIDGVGIIDLMAITAKDLDYITEIAFPIIVEPGEQVRLLAKVPWIVDLELLEVLNSCDCQEICLTEDAYSVYQSRYPIGYIHMGPPDRKKRIPFTQMFVQHNSMFEGRDVELLLNVNLASGERLADTLVLSWMDRK